MRIGFLHIISLLIVLSACLPDPLSVDDVPIPENTVVVGSQNLPEQFLAIAITKNFNALDGGREDDYEELVSSLLIDSLDVTIEVLGESYELDNIELGLYVGTDIPQLPGETYSLSFENPFNQNPVRASAAMLPFVGFDSVGIFVEINEFDSIVNVSMKLQDPPGPNWYMSNVQLINEEFSVNVNPFTELFTDAGQDGELINYDYRVFFRDYAPGDTVLVTLANISQEYYDFLDLRGTRRPFAGSLGEPINYPANIENGLGYFHMHIPDVRIFLPGFDNSED
ncbi:MAG: DUF4249 family protein [Reichenbachiella sp.]|uniref:DUF4249 family protein n=1 Tax=Reichenbachiella sp. TaxID=2184521 RepID=UPI0032978E9E